MSNEPNLNAPSSPSTAVSAIENELPAYRAISPGAVVALILGVLSILSFVSWYFLTLAAAAGLIGYLSDRKIQRFPDALTGRGLAQAGVGLGLIFGLTAVTVTTVQGVVRVRQARAFARTFEDVLAKGTIDEAVWYSQDPDTRARSKPEEIIKSLTESAPSLMSFNEHFAPVREVQKTLAGPKAGLHFVRVESHGEQELTPFVGLVYEVHDPEAKDPALRDREALAVFKGQTTRKGALDWWVADFIFPYKSKTFVAPTPVAKPGDDGHGHSH